MDVTDRDSVKAGFDAAEAQLGTPDIVVCNAGATGAQPFLEMKEAVWDNVLNVNLKGVFNLGQEAAQRMVAAGKPGSSIPLAWTVAIWEMQKNARRQVTNATYPEWKMVDNHRNGSTSQSRRG